MEIFNSLTLTKNFLFNVASKPGVANNHLNAPLSSRYQLHLIRSMQSKCIAMVRIGLVGQSLDKAQLQSSQRNSHTFYGFIEIDFHLTIHPDLCPTGNVAATELIWIQRGRIQFKFQAKC